ncbi:MAG: MBL fold metallo-hydrolase [Clostridiales bacterium]|nr:MBL fold metallo-hydrolase [Clostridiales bacterium]
MAQRAIIKQLLPHLYLIDDAGESTCYLIEGKTHAMVIDTANGWEDLRAIVEGLTQLPVIVVNTHGHGDHILGNVYFDEAWMHPADFELAEMFMGYAKEEMEKYGLKPCPLKPLSIGQVFDLGGLELEVVPLQGHTPGSIGLLDRQDRILFTGDGVNTHLWMQLDGCSSIAELREMLLALKAQHGSEFDYILHGHDKGLREAAVVDQLIQGCDDLLAGRREKDKPYHYFDGECLQHPISDVEGQVIVYTEERL